METNQTIDVESNDGLSMSMTLKDKWPSSRFSSSSSMSPSSSMSNFRSLNLGSTSSSAPSSAPHKLFGQRSLRSSEQRLSKMLSAAAAAAAAAATGKDENNNHLGSNGNGSGSCSSLKRLLAHTTTNAAQVKRWERRLVAIGDSSLVLYRWVPIVVNKNQ